MSKRKISTNTKSIFIIDDDELVLGLLDIVLSEYGYTIYSTDDGDLALQRIRSNPPDLILLDLVMPKKDGTELLKEIKADKTLKTIPTILISSSQKIETIAKQYHVDFIEKPFDLQNLHTYIQKHLA